MFKTNGLYLSLGGLMNLQATLWRVSLLLIAMEFYFMWRDRSWQFVTIKAALAAIFMAEGVYYATLGYGPTSKLFFFVSFLDLTQVARLTRTLIKDISLLSLANMALMIQQMNEWEPPLGLPETITNSETPQETQQ